MQKKVECCRIVTLAMLEAGAEVVSERWVEITSPDGLAIIPELVKSIYLAMLKVDNSYPQTLAEEVS